LKFELFNKYDYGGQIKKMCWDITLIYRVLVRKPKGKV
jgi:hypothetical protein